MSTLKESFKTMIPDVLMLLVSIVGSLLLLVFSPLLHLMNAFRNKSFPTPKVIVITGVTCGIGRSLALKYADNGVVLALIGRSMDKLNELKADCQRKAPNCQVTLAQIDVSHRDKLKKFLSEFDAQHSVDLVIANAGISDATLSKEMSYEEKAYEIINTNVNGAMNTLLPLLPSFRKRRHGQIVLIGSLSPFLSMMYPTYSASKAAVNSYALTLRHELKPYGIGVTMVAPGFVFTHMTDVLGATKLPMAVSSEYAAQTIHDGVSQNRAFIGFSTGTMLTTWFASIIPPDFRDSIYPIMMRLVDTPSDSIVYTNEKEQLKNSTDKDRQLKLFSSSQATVEQVTNSKKIQ
ncbi:short-chain dehydrogenase/reductase (SDR) family protein [Tieghemostelium lacteum]|uniref:Short-chain dehydrogenase/reductase (SDR) family protein n=1 Tax=Tieghemostelium lacteum TaxID=361077 RepID=A0A152A1T2_TIELA|nr:short-chain dehydrogenase/reductase (SDR) family protein [Tieghemostelium lacteum]|eukprot:KYR00031.1 short-chain dehydrogenase/reductase (SDR) family protein [Tieghemostelium lacteum]